MRPLKRKYTDSLRPCPFCGNELPTLIINFAQSNYVAHDIEVNPCTSGVDNGTVKVVGRNILYKYTGNYYFG